MAHKRKSDGVWCQVVYFGDEKTIRGIERAAKWERRSVSEFMGMAADKAAKEAIEERKRLAAERQLGEVNL